MTFVSDVARNVGDIRGAPTNKRGHRRWRIPVRAAQRRRQASAAECRVDRRATLVADAGQRSGTGRKRWWQTAANVPALGRTASGWNTASGSRHTCSTG